MSSESEVVDTAQNDGAVTDSGGNVEEDTQPNMDDYTSSKPRQSLKQESKEADETAENGSSVLPAPKVGIRVKRELLAFDNNINESEKSPEPEPEKEDAEGNMVEFPTVWPCPTCGYTFMSSSELSQHQPSCRHTLTRPHLCDYCNESFEKKQDLLNHIVCHQTTRPHACRVCGNLHRTKGELTAHMMTHQQQQVEKPHKCPTCGQEFARHSSLTNHMKIHTYAAGRALVPPMFSQMKGGPPLGSMMSPAKRNLSSQPERSTEPIPSFETLPAPGYFYNSLMNPQNYAFLASKLLSNMNNGASSSKHVDQDGSAMMPPQVDSQSAFPSSSGTTQITCLPDIGQVDGPEDLPPEFIPQSGFPVDDQNPYDNGPVIEATEQEKVLNSYLSVKNAGLLYGIKVEQQSTQDQNSQHQSEGSPEDSSLMDQSDMLDDGEDSDDDRAPDPDNASYSKENSDEGSSTKPHMCQFCGIHFARLKAYQSHMKLHDENWDTGYICQVCGQKFPDYVALSLHAMKCMRGSRRDDDYTVRELPVVTQLDTHKNINKMAFKHVCSSCDKRFATKQKLFRHMWIHRKKVFTCEACSQVFEERELLDNHRLEKHPPSLTTPFACTVCGKSFTSRQTLWEHGRVHGGTGSGATLLYCQECNKSFASRQGYQIHTRTHTGERPYGCRYCMKSFRDGGTLRKHERIHTGERPHACPLCMRAFNQKVVLREHVRWVHAATTVGEPPLPCGLCSTTLPDREALCAHIVKHSDDLASEVRAATKASPAGPATTPRRRAPRKTANRVLLQAADGKLVEVEQNDLAAAHAAGAPGAPGAPAASDDSSHSTPGSPFPGSFPKMEPPQADLSGQVDGDGSFYAGHRDTSKEGDSEEENTPIPSFSEIAPSKERAPYMGMASTSLDTDMIDPMAYMQVVTDIPNDDEEEINH